MRRAVSCLIVLLAAVVSASAETRIERTLKIDSGGRLEVEAGSGAITVTGASRPDVHVVVTSKGRALEELMSLRFDDGGKTARIVGRSKAVGSFFNLFNWRNTEVHFEIEVPLSTLVSLNTSGGG